MLKHLAVRCAFPVCLGAALSAQVPAKIDFGRDVQPIFKAQCITCHGPALQMNGFRLDRRRDAMKGGTLAMIGPGNSEGSRMYQRLVGNQFGTQMPPTGALPPEQIRTIKAWIDQGAVWPDELSGEAPVSPPDAKAARLMEALRQGDRQGFRKILSADPQAAKRKGPGGATPLMYAVLYADAGAVRLLLEKGADTNVRNEAGATALMWAAGDVEKTRLLLDKGADVNARSDDGRTPLIIAAGMHGPAAAVKLLLDRGANPSAKSPNIFGETTPLSEAAYAGDAAVIEMLLARGADTKAAGYLPLWYAKRSGCVPCLDLLLKPAERDALNVAMLFSAPPLGDARGIRKMLDRGADANAKDPAGRTILMLAASSDAIPAETVQTLIERGADVNAKDAHGETALDFARQRGATPVVDLLRKAGAKEADAPAAMSLQPKPAASARAAVERSIPLLQRNDVTFIRRSGCVSCHNNTLAAMTMAVARKHGFRVDEEVTHQQLKTIATYIDGWRERALQGVGIPGDSDTVSYILLGMAADNHPPDAATDALARYVKSRQGRDGRWWTLGHRPPLESSEFQVTAASMRAMQVYAPRTQRTEYEKAVQLAAGWLSKARPETTEDRAFQILGLGWAGADKDIVRTAARDLIAGQRADGGWAQLPSLASDAYATGQALVALRETGAIDANDPACKRGAQFLLNTQYADGSWYVKSRAIPIQPLFEADFPYGPDQWISAAATNWATMALALVAQ